MQRSYANNLAHLATISLLVAISSLVNHSSAQSVAEIVTDDFFNGIIAGTEGCEGRGFYTRSAFLNAVGSFGAFGTTGSSDDRKREIAAFFGNAAHETGRLCFINEIDGRLQNYCDDINYPQYPCAPGRLYYGRGPLQLTHNYNYGAAGNALNFDGLGDPDAVTRDPVLAFRTSLWYWMTTCHGPITSGQGFGHYNKNGFLQRDINSTH